MKILKKGDYFLVYNKYKGCCSGLNGAPKYMVHIYKNTGNSKYCVFYNHYYHGMSTKTLEKLLESEIKNEK